MKREVYYGLYKIDKFDDILGKYGKNEFNSPYRSTIPLLLLFKSELWNNFFLIDNSDNNVIDYFFEFKTKPIRGNGRASCTDLMIVSQNICIAVEAKRTEPPYEKVKKWLDNSANKKLVLKGWLEMIEAKTKIPIDEKLINDLPYQLIHRVASACMMDKKLTHIVYLGFNLNKTKKDYYRESISSFSKLVGESIKIHLICFEIDKLDEQKRLELGWDGKKRYLSNKVKNGIVNNSLMKFNKL